MMSLNFFT